MASAFQYLTQLFRCRVAIQLHFQASTSNELWQLRLGTLYTPKVCTASCQKYSAAYKLASNFSLLSELDRNRLTRGYAGGRGGRGVEQLVCQYELSHCDQSPIILLWLSVSLLFRIDRVLFFIYYFLGGGGSSVIIITSQDYMIFAINTYTNRAAEDEDRY